MKKIAPLAAAVVASGALLATGALASAQRANANSNVAVVLGKPGEFAIKVAPTAPSGKVTFRIKNSGALVHEMIVIKTTKKAAKLPVSGGIASEAGSSGESGDIAAGATKSYSLTLPKGHYALICNIAGHYAGGMRKDFTVK
jgi:uncharacterized cupredoxin-like copper-binding protein